MHEFRKQTGRQQRRAVDGFLAAGNGRHTPVQPMLRRPRLDGLRVASRPMDNFRRPEGLHPVQQSKAVNMRAGRSLGLEGAAPQEGRPSQTNVAARMGGEQSLLHATLPGGGLLSRKERRRAKKERAAAQHPSKLRIARKWGLRGALVMVALLLAVGGFLGLKAAHQIHKVLKGGGTAAALQSDVKPQLLRGEGDGRVNFLLLGRGGDGHEAPDLTDTILIASIDPVNKTAALVSIPRDLWVTVPGYGDMKINAAYANAKYHSLNLSPKDKDKAETAGIAAIAQKVTDVLGIPIHYYGMVDFHAFEEAVDTVGGVDVNVPAELAVTDHMYDEASHRPYYLNVAAGQQHLDGLKALMYARTRHTSPRGDFDRAERQRLLITALSQKVLSAGTYTNPLKISQLLSTFGDDISTDLSVNDTLRLMTLLKGMAPSGVQSVGLADPPNNYVHTGTVSNSSVVLPTAGQETYDEIHSYIRNTLKDPYLARENASVAVLNGTSTPGLAGVNGDKLKSYGYNVIKVDTAPTADYEKTILVDLTDGKKPFTKNYLEKRFGVQAVTKLPDTAIQADGASFVVILGQDASAHSQN